ncbi:MAG: hypothetical protein J7623_16660 [Chitinophaga sp.]|uniref:hypothetical protein n=1 Tax=Chitinophaga sp. TaxID=1869181 RepID=UPI001B006C33|nr:hypothetical protein [Chitinophaga sp.]MBO9730274.1 hypothetical protein [Chitinophaga sp.]
MWKLINTIAVGGLENIGFDSGDRLVVLSSQGIGIFDCLTGERIFRDRESSWEDFDPVSATVPGMDVLSGSLIRVCGLDEPDFLHKETTDGWMLECIGPVPDDAPFEKYLVHKIFLTHKEGQYRELVDKDGPCELRAYGFSPTGNTLVVALSCDLTIWSRVH